MTLVMTPVEKALIAGPLVKILIGDFGSGKTELTLNFAYYLRQRGHHVTVIDLDLVKPYFHTRENKAELEKQGIRVVASATRYAQADVPVMPQGLTAVLDNAAGPVLIDAGGGDSAIVLGQLHDRLRQTGYFAWLVVNACRPFTSSAAGVVGVMQDIERAAHIQVAGLINNTNLGPETTLREVNRGREVVSQVAQETGLPFVLTVIPHWLQEETLEEGEEPFFVLQPQIKYPWMI